MMKKIKTMNGSEVVINFAFIESIEVNADGSRTIILLSGKSYTAPESEVKFSAEEPTS